MELLGNVKLLLLVCAGTCLLLCCSANLESPFFEDTVVVCESTCDSVDHVKCNADITGFQTCQEDELGCLRWSEVTTCGEGSVCNGGQCEGPSTDCELACAGKECGKFADCECNACPQGAYCCLDTCCSDDNLCEKGECVAGPFCGDGTCDDSETTCSCQADCGTECGDKCCSQGEECEADCGCAEPGSTVVTEKSCGDYCGHWLDECSAAGEWIQTECLEDGVCKPNAQKSCGNCGTQFCADTCQWGACQGEGCKPGTTATCGTNGSKLCSEACEWESCVEIPFCGDGTCDDNESTCLCPADCGTECGDKCCSPGEECEADCGCAEPGSTVVTEKSCGNCGLWQDKCSENGEWTQDVCLEGGVCGAGETDICEKCGTKSCTAECAWGQCTNQGDCSPGETDICEKCGTRSCTAECAWGQCTNQGDCSPGETDICEKCGTRSCTAECSWGTCQNQGCAPEAIESCGVNGTKTCNESCDWGDCVEASPCGNGVCTNETCDTCPDDCGPCTGDCCEPQQDSPWCDDKSVWECVCKEDTFCCETNWDDICVTEVDSKDCGTCEEECGNNNCAGSENCVACPEDCGECTDTSCCTAHQGAGCWDAGIMWCVCSTHGDSYCCNILWGNWNQQCVDEAIELCGAKCG